MQQKFEIARMSWKEVADRVADRPVVLIPVGAVEQHGLQTPTGIDNFVAEHVAQAVAKRTGSLVLPCTPFGCSQFFGRFPGTIVVRQESLRAYLADVVDSMLRHGFEHLVFVDNHAGNTPVIDQLAWDVRERHGRVLAKVFPYGVGKEIGADLYPDGQARWGHGAEPVVSMAAALLPDDVRMDLARKDGWKPFRGFDGMAGSKVKVGSSSATFYFDQHDVGPSGTKGDPTGADGELGKAYLARVVDWTVGFVERFRAVDTRVEGTDGA